MKDMRGLQLTFAALLVVASNAIGAGHFAGVGATSTVGGGAVGSRDAIEVRQAFPADLVLRHAGLQGNLQAGSGNAEASRLVQSSALVEEDKPEYYFLFIHPTALHSDWRSVATAIGRGADVAAAVDAVQAQYQAELERIRADFGDFAARRRLRAVMRGYRLGDSESLETITECFRKLRLTSWPAADAAIERAFDALVTSLPGAPEETALRARSHLRRAVRLRCLADGGSWANLGQGVSIAELVADAPPQARLDLHECAAPVGAVVLAWETEVDRLVDAAFQARRRDALRGLDATSELEAASSRHRSRGESSAPLRRSLEHAIDEISGIVHRHAGIEARCAWDDYAWHALSPREFQVESPTHAWEWIAELAESDEESACISAGAGLERCRAAYHDYLAARMQLRIETRQAVLNAKLNSPHPPRPGSPEASRLAALTSARRELAERCIDSMRESICDALRDRLTRFLDAKNAQADPADEWGNI